MRVLNLVIYPAFLSYFAQSQPPISRAYESFQSVLSAEHAQCNYIQYQLQQETSLQSLRFTAVFSYTSSVLLIELIEIKSSNLALLELPKQLPYADSLQ